MKQGFVFIVSNIQIDVMDIVKGIIVDTIFRSPIAFNDEPNEARITSTIKDKIDLEYLNEDIFDLFIDYQVEEIPIY